MKITNSVFCLSISARSIRSDININITTYKINEDQFSWVVAMMSLGGASTAVLRIILNNLKKSISFHCSFVHLCLLAAKENRHKTTYAFIWSFLYNWLASFNFLQPLLDVSDWKAVSRVCRWCLLQFRSALYWRDCLKTDSRSSFGQFSIECNIWNIFCVHIGIKNLFVSHEYNLLCDSCRTNHRIYFLS